MISSWRIPKPTAAPKVLPDYSRFVTEDNVPVDNFFFEKQQRLLVEPVYSAELRIMLGRPILAAVNAELFYTESQPAIVPDVLLSLDMLSEDLWPRENRSCYFWRLGKPPDVVVEVVSNNDCDQAKRKAMIYARLGVSYSIVFDPLIKLHQGILRVYELRGRSYVDLERPYLPDVGLGVTLWQGYYEEHMSVWLRWCDRAGVVIPTGAELLAQERQRAERAHRRAERLAARLRDFGIDPEAEDG